MANEPLTKKAIWTSIFRLIVPQRKMFLLVVLISILRRTRLYFKKRYAQEFDRSAREGDGRKAFS